ncbi:CAP domain-containing protein [Breoghania sp.]|uniref:CAP domain-containing protein n=1 Tax=Breoghania sp. TaxID=2065378 RepID=UPI002627D6CD|nr:CAP domain-containing protein [Breoghania sp.]MDJ0933296.1 CAP domain-containing protein [Breoghania sp.]
MRPLLSVFALVFLLAGCAGGLTDFGDKAELTRVPVNDQATLAAINGYRAQHRLPPLTLSAEVEVAAQDMADYIARCDKRKSPLHSKNGLFKRLTEHGIRHDAAAENLGYGYQSFDATFKGWQGSPGHDKKLLNSYVTEMGIARTTRPDGMWTISGR